MNLQAPLLVDPRILTLMIMYVTAGGPRVGASLRLARTGATQIGEPSGLLARVFSLPVHRYDTCFQ
jgi:hypothetical protein